MELSIRTFFIFSCTVFSHIAKNGGQFNCQILPKEQRKTTQKTHKKYEKHFEEEKKKKRQYGREWYKNIPEDEKQKLVEYGKNCFKRWGTVSL